MPQLSRQLALFATLGAVAVPLLVAACRDRADAALPEPVWRELSAGNVEGRGWGDSDLAAPYDRLPSRAENTVPPAVWRQ